MQIYSEWAHYELICAASMQFNHQYARSELICAGIRKLTQNDTTLRHSLQTPINTM